MEKTTISINRAPLLTLWGAIVAERLGYSHAEALSLAKVLAGLNAQRKGRTLGIFHERQTGSDGAPAKAQLGEELWVELCDRSVPARRAGGEIRGCVEDKPVDPAKVETYLRQKFGADYALANEALTALATAFAPDQLRQSAYSLYEKFRPEIPRGTAGWGAKGTFDLVVVRKLAEAQRAQAR